MKKMVNALMAACVCAAALSACGGGEDEATPSQNQPVLRPPENGVCATTVPIPPDCPVPHK